MSTPPVFGSQHICRIHIKFMQDRINRSGVHGFWGSDSVHNIIDPLREMHLFAKTNYTVSIEKKNFVKRKRTTCTLCSFSNYISASRILAQLLGIINVGALFACVVVPMVRKVSKLSLKPTDDGLNNAV